MGFSVLALAALAAAAGHLVEHHGAVEHRGAKVEVAYEARTEIQSRTIGAYAPNRMDGRRCLWTATVHVERRLADHPALSRVVSDDMKLKGSLNGACATKSSAIEREIARRDDRVQAHVAAIAAQDRTQLLAELEAGHGLAANDRTEGEGPPALQ